MSRQQTLDKQVRAILQNHEPSRNSDITLMIQLWIRFYPSLVKKITTLGSTQLYVRLTDLRELPREDNIKRVRAKIQNVEKKYVPTNPEVAKKRGWEIEAWRNYLGYEERNHL